MEEVSSLLSLANPHPTKGQRPAIYRNPCEGYVTGRVHICFGCEALTAQVGGRFDSTLERLLHDTTPAADRTRRQRKSHGKPRRGRQYTLYTHRGCREASMQRAQQFIQRQLQESLRAQSDQADA